MKLHEVTWYSKFIALALFVVLPFLGFYAGMKYQEKITVKDSTSSVTHKPNTSTSSSKAKTKINIKTNDITFTSTYENGVVKYSGTVTVPSPCYEVKQDAVVAESFPEQVSIKIKTELVKEVIPASCIQVVTQKPFSGESEVSENASIRVFLNDKIVN
jgi:hypothetical protein